MLSASTIGDLNATLHDFVLNMRATGCYDELRAEITQATTETGQMIPGKAEVRIEAKERNWYKVKIGGGLKHEADGMSGGFTNGSSLSLPTVQVSRPTTTAPYIRPTNPSPHSISFTVQFESSAKLLNLMGDCSTTSAAYNVDQGGSASSHFTHFRPSAGAPDALPFSLAMGARQVRAPPSGLRCQTGRFLLVLVSLGRFASLPARARSRQDSADHQSSRSYLETRKGLFATLRTGSALPSDPGLFGRLEWSATLRDVLPTLHPTTPYKVDASSYVVAEVSKDLATGSLPSPTPL